MRRLAKSAWSLTSPGVDFSEVLLGEEWSGKLADVLGGMHEVSLNIRVRYNYTDAR